MKKCDYCGRENGAEALYCTGCGTPVVPEDQLPQPEPRKKSRFIAVILPLIFGPLGLLYLGGEGFIVIMFIVGVFFLTLPFIAAVQAVHGGVWIAIFGRIGCAVYAFNALSERDVSPDDLPDANTMLNEAARLENSDIGLAIAKYEEVIEMFPDTSASAEAERNIETLERTQAENTKTL
jgi:hypothetical protein